MNKLKTKYLRVGDCLHAGGKAKILGIVFAGILTTKTHKNTIHYEKNEVLMPGAFYGDSYDPIYCKEEAIILTVDQEVYGLIVKKLRAEIEEK